MFSSNCNAIESNLIDAKKYIENIADQMVLHLRQNLADTLFSFKESNCNINERRFGKTVDGMVKFHSGFVVSIDSASLDEKKHEIKVLDEESWVRSEFSLRGVTIAYDVHYDLKPDIKKDAVFVIRYDNLHYEVSVIQKHKKDALPEGKIEYIGVNSGGQYDLIIKVDPETPETQLIARAFRYRPNFRGETERFFNTWTIPLQKALDEAVKVIEYPQIDYFH